VAPLLMMILAREVARRLTRTGGPAGLAFVLAFFFLSGVGISAEKPWFKVNTAQGSIDGYRWATGVKAQKGALDEVCAGVSLLEPSHGDDEEVEGTSSLNCGSLRERDRSVFTMAAFGAGKSRIAVLELVYRPTIGKVRLAIAGQRRNTYATRAPNIAMRHSKNIPAFRYLVLTLRGETCIREIASFDRSGVMVAREDLPPCPRGEDNI
jgi:hypothetical protein